MNLRQLPEGETAIITRIWMPWKDYMTRACTLGLVPGTRVTKLAGELIDVEGAELGFSTQVLENIEVERE